MKQNCPILNYLHVLFTIFFLYITEEIKSVYRLIDLTFINIKVKWDTLSQHLLDKLILVVKIFFSFLREITYETW